MSYKDSLTELISSLVNRTILLSFPCLSNIPLMIASVISQKPIMTKWEWMPLYVIAPDFTAPTLCSMILVKDICDFISSNSIFIFVG